MLREFWVTMHRNQFDVLLPFHAFFSMNTALNERAEETVLVREVSPKYDNAVRKMSEQLRKCRGAMKYAYEDHCDQYYLNVLEDIEKSISEFEEASSPKV